MSESAWYRSLYWRIALGFVGFLAVMLLAQGLLFLWLAGRMAGSVPARSPRRVAELVASDVATALQRDPALDVTRYVHEQFEHLSQPFVIVMADGRTAHSGPMETSAFLMQVARRRLAFERGMFGRGRLFRRQPPFGGPGLPGTGAPPSEPQRAPGPGAAGEASPPERGFDGRDQAPRQGGGGSGARGADGPNTRLFGMRAGPQRIAEFAPIRVSNQVIGVVAVPAGRPPLFILLRELGPTMAAAAAVLLVIGTALVAVIVFRPARRRLQALEAATTRLGAGDMSVRAPETGGDEVTRLARAFNRMAGDLDARARELSASDKARRQLLADVSHELMTPLTAMRGYLETLRMPELHLDPATRERYMAIVDEETLRLEHIIGDLLDLARLEGGGSNLKMEIVPVERLFARVKARHERGLADKRVTLEARIAPGAERVRGDEERLEQALQNLAANALRHTPPGGHISLEATARDHQVVLAVRDTGPGIPAEHLPLIFDRFYKVDASRGSDDDGHSGSGLGLSIVKAIVEQHGGTITASSAIGAGTAFEITLARP